MCSSLNMITQGLPGGKLLLIEQVLFGHACCSSGDNCVARYLSLIAASLLEEMSIGILARVLVGHTQFLFSSFSHFLLTVW
jgi:hypothetical protein